MDTERKQQLEQFIQVLGLKEFHNLLVLDQALTHSSYANENKASHGYYNERLEFLGDAILDLVVGEYLFLHYPNMPEGELSKARASVVSETPLASVCAKFHMGDYILLGKGELATGGRTRPSIMADAFEAVVRASTSTVPMKKHGNSSFTSSKATWTWSRAAIMKKTIRPSSRNTSSKKARSTSNTNCAAAKDRTTTRPSTWKSRSTAKSWAKDREKQKKTPNNMQRTQHS